MATLPDVVPPLPRESAWARGLPLGAGFSWLSLGWRDFLAKPGSSLLYGIVVCVVSITVVYAFFSVGWDYILLPALAGFMVVGPLLATGLYEKSRLLQAGAEPGLRDIFIVRPKSGNQLLFTGVLLFLLFVLWLRAAVIIYALFFGMTAFPRFEHVAAMLFATPVGWWMLGVGSIVGALFASFSFAISVFAIPMLLDRDVDALTAMGTSMTLVWNNLGVMMIWGVIVLALFLISVATGFLGFIVCFPLLGHATWHAYCAVMPRQRAA